MAMEQFLQADDVAGAGTEGMSFWDRLSEGAGNFFSNNADLLLAGAMELNKYQQQQAAAQAQNIINQAASKWSGFNPNLMQMVKPVQQPNIAEGLMSVAVRGPAAWSKLSELYNARKEGPQQLADFLKKEEQQKAINAGLASGNLVAQQAAEVTAPQAPVAQEQTKLDAATAKSKTAKAAPKVYTVPDYLNPNLPGVVPPPLDLRGLTPKIGGR